MTDLRISQKKTLDEIPVDHTNLKQEVMILNLLSRIIIFLLPIYILIGCSKDEYPKDFEFSFKYGVMTRNVLDTFNDKYTKDLVQDGLITTDFALSIDEKKRIYDYMKDIDFFNYPEELEGMNQIPSSGYVLELQYSGNNKVVKWIGGFNDDKKHKEFQGLTELIIEIIESKETYKSLPERKGGYE